MRVVRSIAVILLLALFGASVPTAPAIAIQPDEVLEDPELEARARALGRELRCLVCQNQSIDDSEAELARDLRILVRERLLAGDSDREVKEFVAARYGDFVLLKPPVKPTTWALWFGPAGIFLFGAVVVWAFYRSRRRREVEVVPLSADERRRLDELLHRDGASGTGIGDGGSR